MSPTMPTLHPSYVRPRQRRLGFGVRLMCTALVAGTLGAVLPTTTAEAATRASGPLSLPSGKTYFGALVNHDRRTTTDTPQEVSSLESSIGRPLDIVNTYYPYTQAIGSQGEAMLAAGGRIPMVTWGATDTHAINRGDEDSRLRAQAQRLKSLGGPVFFRYFHEPEGAYRTSIVHTPADYIAAWRRARSIFAQEGATNVIWMFTTTAASFRFATSPPPQAFYPGHDVVDWIAVDGYNFAPGKPGAKWLSFATVIGKWYEWAQTMPKPLMVSEYGVMEDPAVPGRKAQWYTDMRAVVKTNMPLIQGVVAWSTTNIKEGHTFVWNVNSTPSALTSWKAMGSDTYFRPGTP